MLRDVSHNVPDEDRVDWDKVRHIPRIVQIWDIAAVEKNDKPRCSAIVKITPDKQLLASHATWCAYWETVRVLKTV